VQAIENTVVSSPFINLAPSCSASAEKISRSSLRLHIREFDRRNCFGVAPPMTASITDFTPAQIGAAPTAMIAALTTTQVAALTTAQVAALTSVQLAR
jgi:ALTTAQ repeat-containing protein